MLIVLVYAGPKATLNVSKQVTSDDDVELQSGTERKEPVTDLIFKATLSRVILNPQSGLPFLPCEDSNRKASFGASDIREPIETPQDTCMSQYGCGLTVKYLSKTANDGRSYQKMLLELFLIMVETRCLQTTASFVTTSVITYSDCTSRCYLFV